MNLFRRIDWWIFFAAFNSCNCILVVNASVSFEGVHTIWNTAWTPPSYNRSNAGTNQNINTNCSYQGANIIFCATFHLHLIFVVPCIALRLILPHFAQPSCKDQPPLRYLRPVLSPTVHDFNNRYKQNNNSQHDYIYFHCELENWSVGLRRCKLGIARSNMVSNRVLLENVMDLRWSWRKSCCSSPTDSATDPRINRTVRLLIFQNCSTVRIIDSDLHKGSVR